MKFKQRPREEQAEVDTEDDAKNATHNFGIDHEAFLKALTKPRVRVGNVKITIKLLNLSNYLGMGQQGTEFGTSFLGRFRSCKGYLR
jgi:hypothetical protein